MTVKISIFDVIYDLQYVYLMMQSMTVSISLGFDNGWKLVLSYDVKYQYVCLWYSTAVRMYIFCGEV